jgi:hypothetical protein
MNPNVTGSLVAVVVSLQVEVLSLTGLQGEERDL